MLSLQNIRSAEAARSYFSKDNYYSKDTFRAEYFGEGARILSLLDKEVTQERFVELLNGQMAEGEHTPKHKNHRPGYDLTFSAPKSVSVSALAIDDKQLNADMIEAHRAAVDHALRYIEEHLATTRTMNKKTGEKIVEGSGNLLAVKFEHDTSRELDPQLHTHCVVVNATLDRNGQWKALNNEEFYKHQKLVGVIYQSSLARHLTAKGYRIEPQPNGMMELTGFDREQLDHFSTRRQQIKEYMAQYGLSSSRKAEEATLKTRREKVEIDRAELYAAWRHESATLGIGPKTPERTVPRDPVYGDRSNAAGSLRYAVAKLSERNTIMKERDLLTAALADGMGRCTIQEVEAAYAHARKKQEIITTKSRTVVTHLHLDTEKVNIALMQRGRGSVAPVTDADRVTEAVVEFAGRKGFSLSEGQQNSTRLILTTRDRVIGIEGYAGTGKTTMLELVRQEAERNGYAIRGYCPSAAAAKVLQKETGIVSTTLASHLLAQKKEGTPPAGGKEIWIIDEASMVSTLQAADLLKAAENRQARIVLLGDRKQLASVEAGKPFAQLIDNGMAYEKITEIRRQKNVQLREAVYEAMDPEKIVSSLRKLDIEKVPDQHNRLDRMVGDYLALPASDRAKTLLLTSTNDDRRALNGAVRQGLKKEGLLTGPALETGILITTGLTKAELGKIESYHEGQMLRFGRKYKTLGVENGDHAHIAGVDRRKGLLAAETTDGRRLTLDITRHRNLELFDTEKRELRKGDTIQFTKNDKQQDLVNGQQATVVHLDTKTGKLTLDVQGTIRTMRADEIRYLDHAYATTVHSSQGLTCDRVFVNMDTKKELVLGQEAYYVGISRAKEMARIYTDAPEKLPDALKKSLAQKSAIEEVAKDRRPPEKGLVPPKQRDGGRDGDLVR